MKSTNQWGPLARDAASKAHRQEVRDMEVKLEKYVAALAEASAKIETALAVSHHRLTIKPIMPDSGNGSEATAFAVASDWHSEESVLPESVNGLNEFTLAIAEQRIERFFKAVLRLTEIERNGTKIENLVLVLGGDLMTGYIHEELQESNGLSPTQAVIWLRDRVLSGLALLKSKGGFKRIVIPCCYGNHGRTTKKPRHSTGAANSYEWLLYQILAKQAPEYEWHIAESYHTFLEVYGRTIRIHHGDAINYQGGIGGLTIPLEKAIAAWNKAKVADLDIFGHYHQQQQNPKWISNGSLIGYNAFAVSIKAPFEPPQQTFFLWDSKRGRTATWPIFV